MTVVDHGTQQDDYCTSSWQDIRGWMPFGLCQGKIESEYFQEDSLVMTKAAKRICRGCPVKAQCLQWGLESAEYSGIWGGLTPRERRAVAAIAHDGTWRTSVARKPWCPWCKGRDVYAPSERRLQCNGCSFNWPGLLPCNDAKVIGS